MASGISGPKASISKRDKGAPQRRFRVLQALFTQLGLAVILLVLAFVERRNLRSMLLYLVTLIVPVGWSIAIWHAHQRETRARAEGRWSKEFDAGERKRTLGMLGGLVAAWVVLAALVFWLV